MNTSRRPSPKYQIVFSNRYQKDLKKLSKAKYDLSKLETVIDQLAQGDQLADKYRDHELKGQLQGVRECHIAPDWLLLYSKNNKELLLLLVRTGTHRDTLGIE